MFNSIAPKLPMRDKEKTKDFYIHLLGFRQFGGDFDGYLMLKKNKIEIHFFEYKDLDPLLNYGQVYIRTGNIEHWYLLAITQYGNIPIASHLESKPWGQREFSILDPDHNLLTLGEEI